MTLQKVKPILPHLRFNEFINSWSLNKLGDLTIKVGSGSTPLGGEKVYQKEGIIFIRSQNVNNNQLELEEVVFVPKEVHAKMNGSIVKYNDILLNITGASLGRSCVVQDEGFTGNVNQHVCIIRLNEDHNSFFLQLLLSSERGQKLMQEGQTGSGREGLNFQSIRGFKIATPTLAEQTKIATFLTSIDKKIQSLKKKKSLLEGYKKGVMQRIFESENSENKIRFKDDNMNNFPEWEKVKLGDISERIQSGKDKNQIGGMFPLHGSMGIIGLTNSFSYNGKFILIARVGANAGSINLVDGKFSVSDNTLIFEEKKGNDIHFLYYLLMFQNLNKLVFGSGQPLITSSHLKALEILKPCEEEQIKVANFLSSLDQKITNITTQISKTEQWKKGLLQKMFV